MNRFLLITFLLFSSFFVHAVETAFFRAPLSSASLTWDTDNQLVSYEKGGVITTFTYDALGRRLAKLNPAKNTLFISAGQQVIEEYDYEQISENWILNTSYVHASYIDDVVAKVEASGSTGGSPVILYYHSDRQFNVRALSDDSDTPQVVELYAYSPYGKQTVINSTGIEIAVSNHNNSYGFTGRYLDNETGLWYFRARYFSDEMGRFISRDPLGYVDGMSLYGAYFAEGFVLDPTGKNMGANQNPDGLRRIAQATAGHGGRAQLAAMELYGKIIKGTGIWIAIYAIAVWTGKRAAESFDAVHMDNDTAELEANIDVHNGVIEVGRHNGRRLAKSINTDVNCVKPEEHFIDGAEEKISNCRKALITEVGNWYAIISGQRYSHRSGIQIISNKEFARRIERRLQIAMENFTKCVGNVCECRK